MLHIRHSCSLATNPVPPLPLQLLDIGIDVASAMAYLHPQVVHRDLKSQVSHCAALGAWQDACGQVVLAGTMGGFPGVKEERICG